MDDLQVGLGLGPRFRLQPDVAPEPASYQQPPQPVNAVADYADGPSWPTLRVGVYGNQDLGRHPQVGWCNLPVMGVLYSGAIGQGQQRRHRQHHPMSRNPCRVGPPGFIPLPAQALNRLEAQFDPETQRVPTHPDFFRRKVGEDDPRLLLFNVPDREQGATAFSGAATEGGAAADPGGIRTGDKASRGQPAASIGSEGDVFRIPHVGMPALSQDLLPQLRTGQAPVAHHDHGHCPGYRGGQRLQQFYYRVYPGPVAQLR